MMRLKWQKIEDNEEDETTYRAAVPGGWLLNFYVKEGFSAVFMPDPNHEWDGKSVELKEKDECTSL